MAVHPAKEPPSGSTLMTDFFAWLVKRWGEPWASYSPVLSDCIPVSGRTAIGLSVECLRTELGGSGLPYTLICRARLTVIEPQLRTIGK